MKELQRLYTKNVRVLKEDGVNEWMREVGAFVPHLFRKYFSTKAGGPHTVPKDVLFISGLVAGAPFRYRCTHQAEQLESRGITTEVLFFGRVLTADIVDYYDVIILYRVPLTDTLREVIERAKIQNKMVIYDIDDLVFDTKYLTGRSEIACLNSNQYEKYFSGVERHRAAMQLCDYGITSTDVIAREMQHHISTVLVNRNSVSLAMQKIADEALSQRKEHEGVVLGYFSGSSTHNDDLDVITAPLVTILKKFPQARLLLVGPVALPEKLEPYRAQVLRESFVSWEKLPGLVREVDINLAPLTDTLFSDAKSEIKFTEAALVEVPTVASNRDAFVHAIKHAETGFVCSTDQEWVGALSALITSPEKRDVIGAAARTDVLARYSTHALSSGLVAFIQQHRAQKVIYIAPSTKISGGVMVIAQHLQKLQERGYNTLFVSQVKSAFDMSWIGRFRVPVLSSHQFMQWKSGIMDHCVATIWSSVREVVQTPATHKYYFVQNKEYDFYAPEDPYRKRARDSYRHDDLHYYTMSAWCQTWLKDEFGVQAQFVPNGISTDLFATEGEAVEEKHPSKIRILVEGDPKSEYKNVDESFRIIALLDRTKYEIWFISYGGAPKEWYDYDRSFQRVAYTDMASYYRSCDILLKTSRLESFSYPPLEMMACGGVSVVAENPGNAAYVENGENALTYTLGDLATATKLIEDLSTDKRLQEKLKNGGHQTVENWTWDKSINQLETVLKRN